jgi:hypothetical protein
MEGRGGGEAQGVADPKKKKKKRFLLEIDAISQLINNHVVLRRPPNKPLKYESS